MKKKQGEEKEPRLGITPMAVPLLCWFLFIFVSSAVFLLIRFFIR